MGYQASNCAETKDFLQPQVLVFKSYDWFRRDSVWCLKMTQKRLPDIVLLHRFVNSLIG